MNSLEKELALITSVIIHQDLLGGTVFQTFDKAYDLAKEFVEIYPPDYVWDSKDFEETVAEFVKEKTKESNIIAKFMGWTDDFDSITYGSDKWWSDPETHKYQTSWDWLMPVVEKVYSLDSNVDFFKNINLEDTYKAVVQFIKEYNDN